MINAILILCCLAIAGPSFADHHEHKHDKHHHGKKHGKKHRGKHKRRHKAHVHGEVRLGIAVEGNKVEVSWRSPAASVYGFEHEAKTAEDKKKKDTAMANLEKNVLQYLAFDSSLGCKVENAEVDVKSRSHRGHKRKGKHKGKHHDHDEDKGHDDHDDHDDHHGEKHEEHANVKAKFRLACQKTPEGSKVDINIGGMFPTAEVVHVRTISAKTQAKTTLKGATGSVQL